jgi:hypothetical protein
VEGGQTWPLLGPLQLNYRWCRGFFASDRLACHLLGVTVTDSFLEVQGPASGDSLLGEDFGGGKVYHVASDKKHTFPLVFLPLLIKSPVFNREGCTLVTLSYSNHLPKALLPNTTNFSTS